MKKKILIIVISLIIIISIVAGGWLLWNKASQHGTTIKQANTLEEDRIFWNNFLKRNPYLAELKEINSAFELEDTDLVKLAISSEDVELEYINTEEIIKNPVLSTGDGYKKSIENIDNYVKKTFNKKISYNFMETYSKGEEYLILNDNYIYFTKLNLPEKEYILVNFEKENNNFKAEIYEYDVDEQNKEQLEEMLKTGEINSKLKITNKYTYTGTIQENDICISTKS